MMIVELNYTYLIKEDKCTYTGVHLFDSEIYRDDPPNNDYNIIEDLLQERYKDDNATIKIINVNRG